MKEVTSASAADERIGDDRADDRHDDADDDLREQTFHTMTMPLSGG